MIIDCHAHGMHGKYLDEVEHAGGKWAVEILEQQRIHAKKKPPYHDVAFRVEQLVRNGYDMQAVTPVWRLDSNLMPDDVAKQLSFARAVNNNMARMVQDSKGKLIGIGNVPVSDFEKGGRQEMDRAINAGLKGFFIASNFNGKPIDLPEFEPFWAHAAKSGVAILIHPGDPAHKTDRAYEAQYDLMHNFGWPFETELALSRLVFSGIMERYPTLKVVGHHLGGALPFLWGRTSETYTDLTKKIGYELPKPIFDYFSRFYYDTAVGGSGPAIRCACDVFGVDQVVYATDAPHGPGNGEMRLATYPKVIESLGFSDKDKKKIFEDNPRRLFNL